MQSLAGNSLWLICSFVRPCHGLNLDQTHLDQTLYLVYVRFMFTQAGGCLCSVFAKIWWRTRPNRTLATLQVFVLFFHPPQSYSWFCREYWWQGCRYVHIPYILSVHCPYILKLPVNTYLCVFTRRDSCQIGQPAQLVPLVYLVSIII